MDGKSMLKSSFFPFFSFCLTFLFCFGKVFFFSFLICIYMDDLTNLGELNVVFVQLLLHDLLEDPQRQEMGLLKSHILPGKRPNDQVGFDHR